MLNVIKTGDNQTVFQIDAADASFIVGTGGRTRRKLAAVSGASVAIIQDEANVTRIEINGDEISRDKASLYLKYLIQQKHGPVNVDVTPESRDDLTVLSVPSQCVGYITGKKGTGLRTIEEESGTLMFFGKPDDECLSERSQNGDDNDKQAMNIDDDDGVSPKKNYTLAIFGTARNRRAAELRVMCYIEQKISGYFTKNIENELHDDIEGLATDIVRIGIEDLSYAVGKEGNTRRRLCASSGAIIEYIGNYAFIYGVLDERKRAKEYLGWLIAQRTSTVSVDTRTREDVTVVSIPGNVIGYVTGSKGSFFRRVEDETGTFIFVDENKGGVLERVLIFSRSAYGRQKARDFIERRMYEKLCGYADNKSYQMNNGNHLSGRGMNGVRKPGGIGMNSRIDQHYHHNRGTNSYAFDGIHSSGFLNQYGISGMGSAGPNLSFSGRRFHKPRGGPGHHSLHSGGASGAGGMSESHIPSKLPKGQRFHGGGVVPFGMNNAGLF